MEVSTMNTAQQMILESFAGAVDEREIDDLMKVLQKFYSDRLEKEMERLWDNGTLNQDALDNLRKEHLRTPYKR